MKTPQMTARHERLDGPSAAHDASDVDAARTWNRYEEVAAIACMVQVGSVGAASTLACALQIGRE